MTVEVEEEKRQIQVLNEKLQAANTKLCESRNQCQQLRLDLKMAQKVGIIMKVRFKGPIHSQENRLLYLNRHPDWYLIL
jgi:hypothetical protein